MRTALNSAAEDGPRLHLLTEVERWFIKLSCHPAGMPYKLIADHMGIALCTVHTHRRKVFTKLGVPSRAALISLAMRVGLS